MKRLMTVSEIVISLVFFVAVFNGLSVLLGWIRPDVAIASAFWIVIMGVGIQAFRIRRAIKRNRDA